MPAQRVSELPAAVGAASDSASDLRERGLVENLWGRWCCDAGRSDRCNRRRLDGNIQFLVHVRLQVAKKALLLVHKAIEAGRVFFENCQLLQLALRRLVV
jgi:hypothetical protein